MNNEIKKILREYDGGEMDADVSGYVDGYVDALCDIRRFMNNLEKSNSDKFSSGEIATYHYILKLLSDIENGKVEDDAENIDDKSITGALT